MLTAEVIVLEAGLAILGLGIAPPAASWGTMLHDALDGMQLRWWLLVFPGAAILTASAALTAVAEAITESSDPRKASIR
jgi:peptide/nickel transport system permease protein